MEGSLCQPSKWHWRNKEQKPDLLVYNMLQNSNIRKVSSCLTGKWKRSDSFLISSLVASSFMGYIEVTIVSKLQRTKKIQWTEGNDMKLKCTQDWELFSKLYDEEMRNTFGARGKLHNSMKKEEMPRPFENATHDQVCDEHVFWWWGSMKWDSPWEQHLVPDAQVHQLIICSWKLGWIRK